VRERTLLGVADGPRPHSYCPGREATVGLFCLTDRSPC
jgi:hypothetical protein